MDQLPSLSWTLAIVSGWDGGIRFILWKLTSWSTIFNCHVRPAPPIKAAVYQFSSISSAPPGAHLTAACCAKSSTVDHCQQISFQSCLLLCWETLEETSSPPHRTPLLQRCLLLCPSRLLLLPWHPNYQQKPLQCISRVLKTLHTSLISIPTALFTK